MENEKLKYPVAEITIINGNEVAKTVDNTTINIDRTVKELFYNFCESYGINGKSKYRSLNIILNSFMYDEKFEELRKDFFENNFQKEQNLIKVLLNNRKKKLTHRKRGNVLANSKISVPRTLYLDFCKICRATKKRPSLAIQSAMETYIDRKTWGE